MGASPGMSEEKKVVYTAKTHTVGGREHGAGRSSDGRLDVKLSIPGSAGTGTNPEQLFAVGRSGSFEESMKNRSSQDEDQASRGNSSRRRSRFV